MSVIVKTFGGETQFGTGTPAGTDGFVISANGDYQSLQDAIAAANNKGATSPTFYCHASGIYTDDVTLPANSMVIGASEGVNITGTITVAKVTGSNARFQNLTFVQTAAVSPGINSIFTGFAFPSNEQFTYVSDCTFILSGGAVGISSVACELLLSNNLFVLNNATGVLIESSGAGDAETSLTSSGHFLSMQSDSDDVAIVVNDGGANLGLRFKMESLFVQDSSGGSGVIWADQWTAPPGSPGSGMNIASYEWQGTTIGLEGGIAVGFDSNSTGMHNIGFMWGDSTKDTLFGWEDDGTSSAILVVGNLQFFESTHLTPRQDFTVGSMGGNESILIINSGMVNTGIDDAGGSIMFGFAGDPNISSILIRNVQFEGAGHILDFADPATDFFVIFENCVFNLEGIVNDPYFNTNGEDAPPGDGRMLLFHNCSINHDDVAIDLVNTDLFLRNTTFVSEAENEHSINWQTVSPGQPATFAWSGRNSMSKADGTGVLLNFFPSGDLEIVEEGLLILNASGDNQFEVGPGTQVLTNDVKMRPTLRGFQSAQANGTILGTPGGGPNNWNNVYSACVGLHIVQGFSFSFIAGPGPGTDVGTYTLENEHTGVSRSGTTADVSSSVPDTQVVPFTIPSETGMLVGPGQELSVLASGVGANPGTDVQITFV